MRKKDNLRGELEGEWNNFSSTENKEGRGKIKLIIRDLRALHAIIYTSRFILSRDPQTQHPELARLRMREWGDNASILKANP